MFQIAAIAALLLSAGSALRAADAPDTSTWVRFSSFGYAGKSEVTPKPGEFANPIIAGFYPDPSICRVGNDYYLVNSAFNYFPSIPVWHSKDLVHWTQLGNVIDRPAQFAMRGGTVSQGTYAPTIRYHNGTFYVVCTFVGGLGNFYVTASDPRGPWSEPYPLRGVGGMDPSLFFDDDGKCYVTNCDDPIGPALYNGHRTIRLQEVDLDKHQPIGEKTVLVDGGTDIAKKPVWCEGPHLYKINGTYYLLCAEGGTSTAHSVVIFKSDQLRGPYTPWNKNPILTARDLPNNRPNPVTCAGHADLVQTQNGDWYAVFLGCQPYQGNFSNTGRETFLLPVSWSDGWPTILPPKTPVPLTLRLPNLPSAPNSATPTTGPIAFTDNFTSDTLVPRWIGLRAPTSTWFSLDKSSESLLLQPRPDLLSSQGNPTYLAIRQQNNDFTCEVTLTTNAQTADATAGLAALQNETHFYALEATLKNGFLTDLSLARPQSAMGGRGGRGQPGRTAPPTLLASMPLPGNTTKLTLKIEGAGLITRCFFKTPNGSFTQLGEDLPSSFLSTDVAGGFQGVTLGMFARTPAPASTQPANP